MKIVFIVYSESTFGSGGAYRNMAKCGHSDVRIKTYKHKQQQIRQISSHSISTSYYIIRLIQGHSYSFKFSQGHARSFKIQLYPLWSSLH